MAFTTRFRSIRIWYIKFCLSTVVEIFTFNLGEFAIRSLVKIGRQLVNICELSYRRDILECCLNIDNLLLKYKDLLRRRLVSYMLKRDQ